MRRSLVLVLSISIGTAVCSTSSSTSVAGVREAIKRNPVAKRIIRGAAVLGVSALLFMPPVETSADVDMTQPERWFTLQLLHAADMESGAEALENAPRFSSVLNALSAEVEDTVIIGAGDSYIPGPFFLAGNDQSLRPVLGREGSGRANILILNAMGFMSMALGNHEFDAGTAVLAGLIEVDGDYGGTAFPFLSANLDQPR